TLKLDWAELTFQGAGQRVFNVAINGSPVLTNFDVFATAGYKTALQKQFTATANSSGQIVISFTQGSADNPFINGIELYK
ncbi:MAG TPA: malectin domain-containing carbohydrate-binding protein, partial [Candidatus Nitrosopolaris rasttigaisensis]|nr:malectin domain-containing carbohydrate-binding protein [Candidatus Nitrosopolaris rasttigaisensis]